MTRSTRLRLSAMAVLPVLGAGLLAGCGSSDSSNKSGSEPQTITFSYQIANPNAKSVFATLSQQYEKAHPGVTIKTNPIALNTYGSTLTTQLQAGNGPDVFFVNAGSGQAGSVTELAQAGKLLDLTGKVNADVVPDNAKDLFYSKDKLVAIPPYLAPTGLIYSPAAAKDAGVTVDATSTLDDVIAQCKAAQDKGKAIFGLAGAMSPNTAIFTSALAADTVYGPEPDWNQKRAKGEVKFATSDGWKAALQAMKDLYDSKCFQDGAAGAGFDALTNGMGQGKMVSFSAPGGGAKDIMDSTHGAVTLTVLPMPAPSGYQTYLMAGTPDAVAGNAKTKSPKLVEDFLNWMTQPAQSKAAADASGEVPVGKVDTSALLPQYAGVADLLAQDKTAAYGYLSWPNGEVYNALGTGVTGLLTGQKSVDDVLKSMDDAWGN
ncbi:extracellular solute-binding protein [Nocardioides panacihumi]|uniref:Extracellular solute-binding protein n=1 Tax=Nocardioides panacihumi TaxID=400774 RepID=A0ABP5CIL8_9ACTN